jgi:hypothetical protein
MTPPNRSSKHAKVPANPLWHTLGTDQTEEALRTGPQGLSETEARERLATHGPNRGLLVFSAISDGTKS